MAYSEEQAEKHLKQITGRDSEGDLIIEIDDFKNSACLGRVKSIIYESEKSHLNDKEPTLYKHDFSDDTLLISNGKQLLIFGRKLKINYRGVIN